MVSETKSTEATQQFSRLRNILQAIKFEPRVHVNEDAPLRSRAGITQADDGGRKSTLAPGSKSSAILKDAQEKDDQP